MKFTASELFESLHREMNIEELNEIYKALIAYSIGLPQGHYNEIIDDIMDRTLEFYYDNDNFTSLIQEDLFDYAYNLVNFNEED